MKRASTPKQSPKNATVVTPVTSLNFQNPTPLANRELGGLIHDHISNGRLFGTLGYHGGLLDIGYWGNQHLGAGHFFHGALETAWAKLFRLYAMVNSKRYALTLQNTKLCPFGFTSECEIEKIPIHHELLMLPDALVQRIHVPKGNLGRELRLSVLHQEACTATTPSNRVWKNFRFDPALNALITSCIDSNPEIYRGNDALAQKAINLVVKDAPRTTTWIGIGCTLPVEVARGYHERSKYYLTSKPLRSTQAAFYMVFASSRKKLAQRLQDLSHNVHHECDQLLAGYESRLQTRPKVHTGNPILDSAFSQYPEIIHHAKISDRPGAVRATVSGYFVWGWDGLTPLTATTLSNEPESAAAILRFFQSVRHPAIGLPHQFTTSFKPRLKSPFPSQCQFLTGLYHYYATTGDLKLVKEVWPTCQFILDRCRRDKVKNTGLVSGLSYWPDFPEAMEEDGHDISAINNSLLYQGLRCAEHLAHALGKGELAKECRDWAKLVRASFVKYLFDPDKGYFISSCSSRNLKPRKHYVAQAIYWLTPFARELASHAPGSIASFMKAHLRSPKCLLTLPRWDTAWMADGNQLGASFPPADLFYLNIHKLIASDVALQDWLGDVQWFWQKHTVPEAFTPESENEHLFGPDNTGGKQTQACSSWYTLAYNGLAGLDFDHEGITFTPLGQGSLEIQNLHLRHTSLSLSIEGSGRYVKKWTLNNVALPLGSHKIAWSQLPKGKANLKIVRTDEAPLHPVIVRADGLQVSLDKSQRRQLTARITGTMTGEVIIRANADTQISVNGSPFACRYEATTSTFTVPYAASGVMTLEAIAP